MGFSRAENKFYSFLYFSTLLNAVNIALQHVGRVLVELMWAALDSQAIIYITYLTIHNNFEYKHQEIVFADSFPLPLIFF